MQRVITKVYFEELEIKIFEKQLKYLQKDKQILENTFEIQKIVIIVGINMSLYFTNKMCTDDMSIKYSKLGKKTSVYNQQF